MMGTPDAVFRSHSRYNGWSCPPHAFQFIAWGAYMYFGLFYFTCTVPGLLDEWQPPSYVIMAVFFILHIVVHLLACSINPADISVLQKMKKGHREVARFDRTQRRHVIENQHCYLCEVDVGVRSKHCSTCNKCVSDFDHHCKWLNNCVGGRNYRLFIATLASAIAGCLMVLILGLVQFVAYYKDRHKGLILKPYQEYLGGSGASDVTFTVETNFTMTELPPKGGAEFKLFYQTVPDLAWQILVMFTVILAALGTGLLAHLLGFHIYLMCKGLNTYDYIIQEREKSEKAAREKEVDEAVPESTKPRNKHNRVRPDETELSARQTSRSAWTILGGIDENAVVETSRLPRDTQPPTPPPPVRDSYHDHYEGPVQKRKKKKKLRKQQTGYHGNDVLSPINSLRYPGHHGNGHIPTRGDTADLQAAIRKSLEEKGAEGILSDDNLGPSSVKDVSVAVRKPPPEDGGYLATDSGCDIDQESPNIPKAGARSRSEQASENGSDDESSRAERDSANTDNCSNSSMKHPAISIERLNLPHSSDDSDYDGSSSRPKEEKSSQRSAQSSGPRLYHTLPSIGSTVPRTYYETDSGDSLQEIPVSSTRHGSRTRSTFQRSASWRGVGPEIGYPTMQQGNPSNEPSQKLNKSSRNKQRNRKSLGVGTREGEVNHGATLDDYGYGDGRGSYDLTTTPRPPRHRDVPPLDLSPFNESEAEASTRRNYMQKIVNQQKASKI